jgi:hypothetical protein
VDGFGKLVLLHNINYLHKSLFCDGEKVLGLCGSGKHAEVFRVSPLSASSTVELIVPSWRDLKGCQHEADVNALVAPEQSTSMTQFKSSLWITPMVLNTILEANSTNAASLIPILSKNLIRLVPVSRRVQFYGRCWNSFGLLTKS